MKNNRNKHLTMLLTQYYTQYYRNQLGLTDYEQRIQNRLNEEEVFAQPNIEKVQNLLNYRFDTTKRILVIGGGTGAEFVQFAKMGCDTYTIEPNEEALEIIRVKCNLHHINKKRVYKGIAENLPFENDYFDFIYCFAVIEHVQNVEKAIHEAIRVTKPQGYLCFRSPDYRQCYERHYKLYIPMFLPKWMIKILLVIKKRSIAFLDTLQFVTAKQLRNVFRRNNVIALQVYLPYETPITKQKGWNRLIRWIQDTLGIEAHQFWILQKL